MYAAADSQLVAVSSSRSAPFAASAQTATPRAPTEVAARPIVTAATSARVRFTAGPDAREGTVSATLGDDALVARVQVVEVPGGPEPPPLPEEIDLSGWTLRQANSARTFTFPAGFRLLAGDTVVVGRAVTQAAFETYWNVAFGEDGSVIFATARTSVYRIQTKTRGAILG